MNIDEICASIPNAETEIKSLFQQTINDWRLDNHDVDQLGCVLIKLHGNVWFKDEKDSNNVYKQICKFKHESIECIGGMTINERLYAFGLFDEYDKRINKSEIYSKLKACI